MSRVQIIDLEPKVMRRDSLFREMVRGLLLVFVIVPLRLVAGRRRHDDARISALELELGLREPENLIEQHADPDLICTPGIGYQNAEAKAWRDKYAQPRRGTREWRSDYERGQDEARDWLDHLGHDHERIDVTAIGDATRQYIRGRCIKPGS